MPDCCNCSACTNLTSSALCNHLHQTRRFLWQVQYLIAQGIYVLLDFNSQRGWEHNMLHGQLLARNWGTLWQALTDLPEYKEHMLGRVFPDLANEPRREWSVVLPPCLNPGHMPTWP